MLRIDSEDCIWTDIIRIFLLSTRGTTSYQIVLCWIFLEVLTRFFNAFMGHFRTFGQHLYNTMQHGK